MADPINFPKFVTPKWVEARLGIGKADVAKMAEALAASKPEWAAVKDPASFAKQYLDSFSKDPGVGVDCRNATGKKPGPLFTPATYDGVPAPASGASARKLFGNSTACAEAAAFRGEHDAAKEFAMQEILEYGAAARNAFVFAYKAEPQDEYAELLEAATSIEELGLALSFQAEGMDPEASHEEAGSQVLQSYRIARLVPQAIQACDADDAVEALKELAEEFASAASAAATYRKVTTTPLSTAPAVASMKESIASLDEHLEGAEDPELLETASKTKELVEGCAERDIERYAVCEANLMAAEAQDQAADAVAAFAKTASIKVKSLADAKKVEKGFLSANALAKKSFDLVAACATFLGAQKNAKGSPSAIKEFVDSISKTVAAAAPIAAKDMKKPAPKPQAKAQAKPAPEAPEKEAPAAKAPAKEAPAPEAPAAGDSAELEAAKKALLQGMKDFAGKRWDTNLATQTLRRLVDRRKEVVGQLWEAVEKDESDALRRAEKFIEQFRNTMDARRRLDAVVRIIGRGQSMDPRTQKWFTDSLLKLSELAGDYVKARS